jgi:tetratricopeptide (TPR) repeat protein
VLHIDCLLGAGDIFGAEREVIKLVELEPANYPKFLELAGRYLEIDDTVSAARILSMSSEHMLVGGQADDFHGLVAQVLDKDPENLEGLRLMTRFCTWQKDEAPLRTALARLAEAAHAAEAVDDERYALLQLVMLVPQNIEYKQRLREINDLHGYEQLDEDENLFEQHFLGGGYSTIDPSQVSFESSDGEAITFETESAGEAGFEFVSADPQVSELFDGSADEEEPQPVSAAAIGREMKLQKEVDSIRFYIDNGYIELAAKATAELRHEFGGRSEVVGLEADIVRSGGILEAAEAEEVAAEEHGSAVYFEAVAEAPDVIQDTIGTGQPEFSSSGKIEMDQLRSELGLDDPEADDGSGDYETHYNTAVAYREMGLLEEAIKAFQDAVTLTGPADGTRRFFSCANMLGHCFMEKQMPQLALRWFQKALESSDLTDEERQGIWYELAGAYEAGGDTVNAGRYFEQVYAENVNFRDVSERVRSLSVNR